MTSETTVSNLFNQAQQLIGEIQAVAQAVLETGNQPPLNTERFTQLLAERDDKLRQLSALDLTQLPDEQRQTLWESLEASKARDLDVENHLSQALSNLDTQLQQLHHGRQVMNRYKLNITGHENTRSDRA